MSTIKQLASTVEAHFTNPEAAAFAHFVTVTDGLSAQQAAAVPAERFNSVWAVVNHTAFWQDLLRTALQGEMIDLAAWGLSEIGPGWPPVGEVSNSNWQAARQRALDVNHALAQAIANLGEVQLEQPLASFFNLSAHEAILSIYAHNSYHTAEIIGIRHMQGLWVDHPFV
jgi:hypothetical protein